MKSAAAILMMLSVSILPAASCKKSPAGAGINGTISFFAGDVKLNDKKAIKDDTVKFGDLIETGKNSTCRILFLEKNLIMVSENTRLVYRIKPGDSLLELSRGGMGAIIRKKLLFKDLTVKTPTLAAAVRGTIFYVGVEGPDRTYACVCNGRIHFRPEGADREELIQANHHAAHYYTRERGKIKIEKAGLKYHSDEALNMVVKSIGETIDWTKIE